MMYALKKGHPYWRNDIRIAKKAITAAIATIRGHVTINIRNKSNVISGYLC